MKALGGLPLALALFALPARASAAPQANAALTIGGAVTELRSPDGPRGKFHFGGRADVLFLRERDRDMAVGPYLDLVTAGFDTIEVGTGVAWLVPVWPAVPFVFSAGAFERKAPGFSWEAGAVSTIFVGARSYNFHSWYELAAGFFVQGRYGLGDAHQADVIAGMQLDLSLLGYPFLLAYQALTH